MIKEMAAEDERALVEWLPRQRWYGAKGTAIAQVRVADRCGLLALVEVTPAGGEAHGYAVPEYGGSAGLESEELRQEWWKRLRDGARLQGEPGEFQFETVAPLAASGGSQLLGAEQSNTSVLYRDAGGKPSWVLKLYRQVQNGENPDFEIPRALARYTNYRQVPAAAGRLLYRAAGGETATLAVAQAYVPNQGDGWEYALRRLRAGEGGELLPELERLGGRTAGLHAALASITTDAAFAPEPIGAADGERWRQRALAGAGAAAPADRALIEPWRQRLEAGAAGLEGLAGCSKIRIHGDYHLGQTLTAGGDFFIFDFEGEPARPLVERRRKGTALQDVAGMLRSLGYAAHTAGQPDWEAPARAAFLGGYRAAIAQAAVTLVPAGEEAFTAACSFFECEKAVYELAYERNHRPEWVDIPVAALRRLMIPINQ